MADTTSGKLSSTGAGSAAEDVRSDRKPSWVFPLIILLLAVGCAALQAFAFPHDPLRADDAQYDRLGLNLATVHRFSLSEGPPYLPTMYREPLYPFFLAVVYGTVGHSLAAVQGVQCLLHAAVTLMVFWLAGGLFNARVARLAGLLTALDPALTGYGSYVLTEPLTTFLLLLIVCCLWLALAADRRHQQRLALLLLLGGLLGLLSLCRAAYQFLGVAIVPLVMVILARSTPRRARLVGYLSCLLAGLALTVAPWIGRNYWTFHVPAVTIRSGITLLARSRHLDYSPWDMVGISFYLPISRVASPRLAHRLFPRISAQTVARGDPEVVRLTAQINELSRKGYSESQIDAWAMQSARATIRRHPFKYLAYSVFELAKMAPFEGFGLLGEDLHRQAFESQTGLYPKLCQALKLVGKGYSLLLIGLAVLGIIEARAFSSYWRLCLLPIVYTVGIYALVDAIPRYVVPVIPFLLPFAALSLASIMPARRVSPLAGCVPGQAAAVQVHA